MPLAPIPRHALLLAAALGFALPWAGSAQASEVKHDMRLMKQDMKGAQRSATLPELAAYADKLQQDSEAASHLHYGSDDATYRKGMQQLMQEIALLQQRIHANDLPGAQKQLDRINTLRKHYHDLLN